MKKLKYKKLELKLSVVKMYHACGSLIESDYIFVILGSIGLQLYLIRFMSNAVYCVGG